MKAWREVPDKARQFALNTLRSELTGLQSRLRHTHEAASLDALMLRDAVAAHEAAIAALEAMAKGLDAIRPKRPVRAE